MSYSCGQPEMEICQNIIVSRKIYERIFCNLQFKLLIKQLLLDFMAKGLPKLQGHGKCYSCYRYDGYFFLW